MIPEFPRGISSPRTRTDLIIHKFLETQNYLKPFSTNFVIQLNRYSDRVLSPDSEYGSQTKGGSQIKGGFMAFLEPLSDKDHLSFTCNSEPSPDQPSF